MERGHAAADGTLRLSDRPEEAVMPSSPQPGLPSAWASDKVDLDELFRDAKPVGDVSDWAIPGFFADKEEFGHFQVCG
jgi:hypothetical protein